MTDLSPAAQAVLNAWTASKNGVYLEDDPERLAAALRAAVDQVLPIQTEIIDNCWYEVPNSLRDQFLEIAAELEGVGDGH